MGRGTGGMALPKPPAIAWVGKLLVDAVVEAAQTGDAALTEHALLLVAVEGVLVLVQAILMQASRSPQVVRSVSHESPSHSASCHHTIYAAASMSWLHTCDEQQPLRPQQIAEAYQLQAQARGQPQAYAWTHESILCFRRVGLLRHIASYLAL